ncbi:MAG TPA: hypothetical protein VJ804_15145 [Acidimicrobiales bacterium]|nr:hypothetical protein [Acidimicrobiales bacterium]
MSQTSVQLLLFTDLVGSTALSASLTAAQADALRRTHLGLMREVPQPLQ